MMYRWKNPHTFCLLFLFLMCFFINRYQTVNVEGTCSLKPLGKLEIYFVYTRYDQKITVIFKFRVLRTEYSKTETGNRLTDFFTFKNQPFSNISYFRSIRQNGFLFFLFDIFITGLGDSRTRIWVGPLLMHINSAEFRNIAGSH